MSVLSLENRRTEKRWQKHLAENPGKAWLVRRSNAALDVLNMLDRKTSKRARRAGREAARGRDLWAALYAWERILAETFWGDGATPPPVQGETWEAGSAAEAEWFDGRIMAALALFGDDESKRAAALLIGTVLRDARGEDGPWPCVFAVERLAALVLSEAQGEPEAEAGEPAERGEGPDDAA